VLLLSVLLCCTILCSACASLSILPSDDGPQAAGVGHDDSSALQHLSQLPALELLPEPRLELTPEVRLEMRKLVARDWRFIDSAIERRDEYHPIFLQIFNDEGVPASLINLAIIESGFSTKARSRAGAVGIWQFMKATARLYGLQVTRLEDQRTDPVLSTIAAARLLRDLYGRYNDWYLALAAYNAGSGTVNRALARTGADTFWEIARKPSRSRLRKETIRYVPRFIAVTYLMQQREKLGAQAIAKNIVDEALVRG